MFHTSKVNAVDDVTLSIKKGDTLGLVGESGCGKSTLARLILNLLPPDSGRIVLGKQEIAYLKGDDLTQYRRKIQIVFQQPFSSFDPLYRLKKSLLEPLKIHGRLNKKSDPLIKALVKRVGLHGDILNRYPHEVSGGELQRVAIARALVLKPEILILDEPTSMLDVSMQAKVLNLLKEIQKEYKISFLFISHDLDAVCFMSENIAVMNKGKIVEQGPRDQILYTPEHAYTKRLIAYFNEFNSNRAG